ncbi:diguanylate cyclase [Robbsia sp. Bb-Pol-6]|uniref:diguanylate cyclase n=1 Tax=Robbsia betulipollinis TaxID=2981849 RepID=A0ABT3ZH79_9BURK|nr:diguanylate cyclase [Robbsia betulipollinis]MCY0385777.1 diguanylate cyclase [Robbsia betulipollinis]
MKRIRAVTARHPRRTLVFSASLCIVMALLSVLTLWQQWLDARDHAVETSVNVLTIIQKDIERNIELYDLSLQAAAAGVLDPTVMRLPNRLRDAILFDASARASDLGSLFVLDRQGNVLVDCKNDPPKAVNLADRDFFKVHVNDPDRGLFVSQPVVSRLAPGQRAIVLSRRVTAADGSFAGVAGIGIKLSYFARLFSSVKLHSTSAVALLNDKGMFLTRMPPNVKFSPGQSSVGPALLASMSAHGEGTITRTAAMDGVERLYVFRHLPQFGMIIVVAPSTEDVFGAWRSRAAIVAVLMVVFSAALLFVSVLLSVELRDRMTGEAAMRALARTDSLTGLATRRVFDETIRREWAIARRSARPLTLVFIDVDHFKSFNDAYGHMAGDEALVRIAGILAAGLRYGSDIATRYGGEEFVLVLADTTEEVGALIAERIRATVEDCGIPHVGSPLGHLTISLGIASYNGASAGRTEELVKRADQSLYRAKQNGRNRVASGGLVAA